MDIFLNPGNNADEFVFKTTVSERLRRLDDTVGALADGDSRTVIRNTITQPPPETSWEDNSVLRRRGIERNEVTPPKPLHIVSMQLTEYRQSHRNLELSHKLLS